MHSKPNTQCNECWRHQHVLTAMLYRSEHSSSSNEKCQPSSHANYQYLKSKCIYMSFMPASSHKWSIWSWMWTIELFLWIMNSIKIFPLLWRNRIVIFHSSTMLAHFKEYSQSNNFKVQSLNPFNVWDGIHLWSVGAFTWGIFPVVHMSLSMDLESSLFLHDTHYEIICTILQQLLVSQV